MKCPLKQILEQMKIVHKSFIWDNKKPKMKHSTLIVDYFEGGYKDTDIETKSSGLKAIWVKKLLAVIFIRGKLFQLYSFQVLVD